MKRGSTIMSTQYGAAPEQEALVSPQEALVISKGGATREQTLRNIGLIAGYEFKRRIKQRSFIIVTLLISILVILAACAPTVIAYVIATSNTQTQMVVVNTT